MEIKTQSLSHSSRGPVVLERGGAWSLGSCLLFPQKGSPLIPVLYRDSLTDLGRSGVVVRDTFEEKEIIFQ